VETKTRGGSLPCRSGGGAGQQGPGEDLSGGLVELLDEADHVGDEGAGHAGQLEDDGQGQGDPFRRPGVGMPPSLLSPVQGGICSYPCSAPPSWNRPCGGLANDQSRGDYRRSGRKAGVSPGDPRCGASLEGGLLRGVCWPGCHQAASHPSPVSPVHPRAVPENWVRVRPMFSLMILICYPVSPVKIGRGGSGKEGRRNRSLLPQSNSFFSWLGEHLPR